MSRIDFFIELKNYSASEISTLFRKGQTQYNELIEKRYLRRNGHSFQFHFVGLIEFNTTIVVVLPKYHQRIESYDDSMSEAVRIIRVFRKMSKSYTELPDFENISYGSNNYNEIAVADSLIADYLDHGLLRLQHSETTVVGIGETNWDRTVATLFPIFSKGRPIYQEVLNDDNFISDQNIITEIHKWVLKKVIEKYGTILGYDLSNTDFLNADSNFNVDSEVLRSVLHKELQASYIDRNIRVLQRLLAFVDKSFNPSQTRVFYLFGTGFFHIVWEQVCKVAFNDQMYKFQHLLAKPVWVDVAGQQIQSETLRPDILCFSSGYEQITFVLDAKYYNFKFSDVPSIVDNPGIGDLSKQFLYKVLIEKIIEGNVVTAFLFPRVQTEQITFLGHVQFAGFPNEKVFLFALSTQILFESFLADRKIGLDCLSFMLERAM
jgi:hypothetical protein